MPHRLFIGIRPPHTVRDILLDTMEGIEGARWQDDERLHLTLRFVGEVEGPAAEDLATTLGDIVWPPFDLAVEGVSHFEHKGMPRAVWARLRRGRELKGLRLKIERACERTGLGRETRRFTPHITIARLGPGAGPVAPWLIRHAGLRTNWQADGFTLFESRLLASGPQYDAVADYPMRG